MAASRTVKLEHSPPESPSLSFSTPGELAPSVMLPSVDTLLSMTPNSLADPESPVPSQSRLSSEAPPTPTPAPEGGAGDKKQTKKRKSWGQVLPEPKTCLPPRKRAKTVDEKEQRRVERVLRNRRAAQSSRERKRQEVEALEHRNKELELLLQTARRENQHLAQELSKYRRDPGVLARASPANELLRSGYITLSTELFGAHGRRSSVSSADDSLMADSFSSSSPELSNPTVNPQSLSPEPRPSGAGVVTQTAATVPAAAETATAAALPSADQTQPPAEMLCDLQCQSATPATAASSETSRLRWFLAILLQLSALQWMAWTIRSFGRRPLTQIAFSSKTGASIAPSRSVLMTIIWLVTSPWTSATSSATSPASSTSPTSRTAGGPFPALSTLRIRLLRKLLTCSPDLARPLADATLAALRLVVSDDVSGSRAVEKRLWADLLRSGADGGGDRGFALGDLPQLMRQSRVPSWEALVALFWVIRVYGRRRHQHQQRHKQPQQLRRRVPDAWPGGEHAPATDVLAEKGDGVENRHIETLAKHSAVCAKQHQPDTSDMMAWERSGSRGD